MDIIYTKLGNDVNRPLCEKFIDSGYDMNILISKLNEQNRQNKIRRKIKIQININGKISMLKQRRCKGVGIDRERSRTGYERVDEDESYFVDDTINDGYEVIGDGGTLVNNLYYNNVITLMMKPLPENNARADKLFRCLRQWQALHDQPITVEDWEEETEEDKFSFFYDYTLERILISLR